MHPAIVQMLIKEKAADKICLVTDAVKPTCVRSGKRIANRDEVYLGDDHVFHRVEDDVIAGSALTMNRAVKNMVGFGSTPQEAFLMASYTPASVLGLSKKMGMLLPGSNANLLSMTRNITVLLQL